MATTRQTESPKRPFPGSADAFTGRGCPWLDSLLADPADFIVVTAQRPPTVLGRQIRPYGTLLRLVESGVVTRADMQTAQLAGVRVLMAELQDLAATQPDAVWIIVTNPVNAICSRLVELGIASDDVRGVVDVDRARRQLLANSGEPIMDFGNHGGTVGTIPTLPPHIDEDLAKRSALANGELGGTMFGAAAAAVRMIAWHRANR